MLILIGLNPARCACADAGEDFDQLVAPRDGFEFRRVHCVERNVDALEARLRQRFGELRQGACRWW